MLPAERPRRAFLFDLDGVLVDSEREWHQAGAAFVTALYGRDILDKMGERIGLSVDAEYDLAASLGFRLDRQTFYDAYDAQAMQIYARAAIDTSLNDTIDALHRLGYLVSIVSSSRRTWIEAALARLADRERFACIVSLGERRDLRSKPKPDGYLAAMRELAVRPEQTLVLEDSNNGIRAGKAAGATVIGYRAYLIPGYEQADADYNAGSLADVVAIARMFARA